MNSLGEENAYIQHICKYVALNTTTSDFFGASGFKDTLTYFRD